MMRRKKDEGTIDSGELMPEIIGVEDGGEFRIDIVRYDNDMNDVAFKEFTVIEMRIFIAILGSMNDKGGDLVVYDFSDIRNAIGEDSKHLTDAEIYDMLEKISQKLSRTFVYVRGIHKKFFDIFDIFSRLKGNMETKTFEVQVSPNFISFLNDLGKRNELGEVRPYTELGYKDFVGLKSKYSQTLHRLLSQWKAYRGKHCFIPVEKLKIVFCAKDVEMWRLRRDMLYPAIEELRQLRDFKHLRIYEPVDEDEKKLSKERIYLRWDRVKSI